MPAQRLDTYLCPSYSTTVRPNIGGYVGSIAAAGNPGGFYVPFFICGGICALALAHSFCIRWPILFVLRVTVECWPASPILLMYLLHYGIIAGSRARLQSVSPIHVPELSV